MILALDNTGQQLLGQNAQSGTLVDIEQTKQFVEGAHPRGSNVRAGRSAHLGQVERNGAAISLGGFPDHDPFRREAVDQTHRTRMRETKCPPQPVDRHARLVSEQRYGGRRRSRFGRLGLSFAEQGVNDGQGERPDDIRSSIMGHSSKLYA